MIAPAASPAEPLRELALFAGGGGGILAGRSLGWRCVGAVEIEPYPRAILAARQADGFLEPFPILEDVCQFNGRQWRGRVDVVSGGFPCQDVSPAGKGAGLAGEKSGLWSEMARIIGEVRPRFAFVENSPFLKSRGLDVVLADLACHGYAAAWGIVGAHHVGSPHKRDRLWIVAERRRSAKAARAAAGGPPAPPAFARLDRSATWRSGQLDLLGELDEFSAGWPDWGTMTDGECREASPPASIVSRAAAGPVWPTPCLPGNGGTNGKAKLRRMLYPAPMASEDKYRLAGNSQSAHCLEARGRRGELSAAAGPVNPAWREWLMGWPVGWSSLEPLDRLDVRPFAIDPGAEGGDIPRTLDAVESWADRIRATGNGQVPAAAELAFVTLRGVLAALRTSAPARVS